MKRKMLEREKGPGRNDGENRWGTLKKDTPEKAAGSLKKCTENGENRKSEKF